MIRRADLVPVGRVVKPHGIKGEWTCSLNVDEIDFDVIDYIILDVEGIFVPFHIRDRRRKNSVEVWLSLDDIPNDCMALEMKGKTLYIAQSLMTNLAANADRNSNSLAGYTLIDKHYGTVGEIEAVDTRTENTLFIIGEYLIPAGSDYITDINHHSRTIHTTLPEGLLEL
ncbi:MAG: hypothetical protein LBS16_01660 [Prevotellaceae bacterium]|jgi:16S rRNA processing protein RimM|nr:hypothetical protein [Prevotellaceae bacterium]